MELQLQMFDTPAHAAGIWSGLPFGAYKGPGHFTCRMSPRSCRGTLARRRGGRGSLLALTNTPVRHTRRLMVADTSCPALVSQASRPLLMATSVEPRASAVCCGIRDGLTLALCHGTARCPIGGAAASLRLVAFVMALDPRSCVPSPMRLHGVMRSCLGPMSHLFCERELRWVC